MPFRFLILEVGETRVVDEASGLIDIGSRLYRLFK